MVKILFLVKNGQKGRHGCAKSEHVLSALKPFALAKRFECNKAYKGIFLPHGVNSASDWLPRC